MKFSHIPYQPTPVAVHKRIVQNLKDVLFEEDSNFLFNCNQHQSVFSVIALYVVIKSKHWNIQYKQLFL